MTSTALILADDVTLPNGGEPAVTERYGPEVRQSFLDRPDKLHFLVSDEKVTIRLYEENRSDGIREIEEDNSPTGYRRILFRRRPDHLLEYTRTPSSEVSKGVTYSVVYDEAHPRGVKKGSLELKEGAHFSPTEDTPPIVYREKSLHISLELYDHSEGRFSEFFQDQENRTLRIVLKDDEPGTGRKKNALFFENESATDSEEYEEAKFFLAHFVHHFVQIERDLFLNVAEFVPHETKEEAMTKHAHRLTQLANALFDSMDTYTGTFSTDYSPPRGESPSRRSRPGSAA